MKDSELSFWEKFTLSDAKKSLKVSSFTLITLTGLLYILQSTSFEINFKTEYLVSLIFYYLIFSSIVFSISFFLLQKNTEFTLNKMLVAFVAKSFLIFLFFYTSDLNTLIRIYPRTNIPAYNIEFKKPIIVDTRYNCSGCNFSINQNDVLLTSSIHGKFLKVIHTPGTFGYINKKSWLGFFLKTKSKIKLKQDQYVAQIGNSRVQILVNAKQIRGKVTYN